MAYVSLSQWAESQGFRRQWAWELVASYRVAGARRNSSGDWEVPDGAKVLTADEGRKRKARSEKESGDV